MEKVIFKTFLASSRAFSVVKIWNSSCLFTNTFQMLSFFLMSGNVCDKSFFLEVFG